MKIICAPDSFKGSISAVAAAGHMAAGVQSAVPDAEIDVCPISDGGEGFVEAIACACGGSSRITTVTGPLGDPVDARWLLLDDDDGPTAVMEMAEASGLARVPEDRRDPTRTTTFGTGEMMRAALVGGARRIIIGIGGSATNDGGCGMAAALGARFYDRHGHEIPPPGPTGGTLAEIARIDMTDFDPGVQNCQIIIASDVTNFLTGSDGAAAVYAPQKGASPQQVDQLEYGLLHLAKLWHDRLGIELRSRPGGGAAGGLGAGLMAFCGAGMQPGASLLLDLVGFERRVAGCDLCLTGEGRIDGQTLYGKACVIVAEAAARHQVPAVALVGSVGDGADRVLKTGLSAYEVIGPGLPAAESMARAGELIEQAAARAVRQLVT